MTAATPMVFEALLRGRIMPMVLVPLDGGAVIPLEKAIVFFGRGAECDVVLNTSRKVSRKHFCIAQIDSSYLVRDLGSMNGLRVNERPVDRESRIASGDELWVGDLGFRFVPSDHESARAARAGRKPVAAVRPGSPRAASPVRPVPLPDDEQIEFAVEVSMEQPAIPVDEIHIIDDDEDSRER